MNRKLIIVGAIAILAFGATYVFLRAPGPAPAPVAQAQPKIDMEQVLVAAQNLQRGDAVKPGSVTWRRWLKANVSEWMITRSGKPDALKDVEGSMARADFLPGEPIRNDKLVKAGAGGFIAAVLPSGKRAVAIKIDNNGDSTAGGFIRHDDRVDVVRLARDDEATKARGVEVMTAQTILTNVRVLAIGQNDEENGKKVVMGNNATLELDPDQVNRLLLAQHQGNSSPLHLVLRSLADSGGGAQTVVRAEGGLTVVRYGAAQQASR